MYQQNGYYGQYGQYPPMPPVFQAAPGTDPEVLFRLLELMDKRKNPDADKRALKLIAKLEGMADKKAERKKKEEDEKKKSEPKKEEPKKPPTFTLIQVGMMMALFGLPVGGTFALILIMVLRTLKQSLPF